MLLGLLLTALHYLLHQEVHPVLSHHPQPMAQVLTLVQLRLVVLVPQLFRVTAYLPVLFLLVSSTLLVVVANGASPLKPTGIVPPASLLPSVIFHGVEH